VTGDWAVSLHDVAPETWPACRRLLSLLEPFGVPVTLLVVPHFHGDRRLDEDRSFVRALRARVAGGDEVALHGYYHVDDAPAPDTLRGWFARRVLTAAEGEFAALDAVEAGRRLAAGARLLARAGVPPAGFVAPAWLLGAGALAALADTDLAWTSTRDTLYALPSFTAVQAPSLVYSTRSAWRRATSRHWNRWRLARLADEPRLRVALHPAEADHPAVLAEWTGLLGTLARPRRPVLESAWLPVRASASSSPARSPAPAWPAPAAAGSDPCRRGSLPRPSPSR
jgi:predicted deacetylase